MSLWDEEPELARLYTVASYAWNKAGEWQTAARFVRLAAEIHERKGYTAQMAVDMFRKAAVTSQLGEPTFDLDQAREKLIALGWKNAVAATHFRTPDSRRRRESAILRHSVGSSSGTAI